MALPESFPTIEARRLTGGDIVIPSDLDGDPLVLAVAFRMWQQGQVDSWVPWADDVRARVPGLRFYEIPVLGAWWRPARAFIDGGMRRGIGDDQVSERTLTAYTNPLRVAGALGLTTLQIGVYVVAPAGRILAGARGAFARGAGERLAAAVTT